MDKQRQSPVDVVIRIRKELQEFQRTRVVPLNKGASPRQEAEILTNPTQVILDIRNDIQKFQDGGPRKEMVEALKDQFVAARHQAAVKAEAARMLALDMLRAKLHEIKSVSELTCRALGVVSFEPSTEGLRAPQLR